MVPTPDFAIFHPWKLVTLWPTTFHVAQAHGQEAQTLLGIGLGLLATLLACLPKSGATSASEGANEDEVRQTKLNACATPIYMTRCRPDWPLASTHNWHGSLHPNALAGASPLILPLFCCTWVTSTRCYVPHHTPTR